MTFNNKNFAPISGGESEGVPKIWGYISATDAIATVAASAYFNDYATQLRIGDVIYIVATDEIWFYSVTAVTPNVTVAAITAPA